MKGLTLKQIALSLVAVVALGIQSAQANSIVSCKIKTSLGTEVTGNGSSRYSAQSDASKKCFDKQLDVYQMARGGNLPNDDQASLMMDACVNARCL